MNICCVIVTYNRLELLKQSINSVLKQNESLKKIIVINNASTDGTQDYLEELSREESVVDAITLDKNVGGSGGFYEGIKKAMNYDCDWIWIMDDDTIVTETSLTELIKSINKVDNVGYICSKVLWKNDDIHYMNIPQIQPIIGSTPFNKYGENLVVNACSFVSVLVNAKAVKEVGLPYKEFFIWSDDTEYTNRITKNGYTGIYAPNSIVYHYTGTNYNVDMLNDTKNNYWKYAYGIRNGLFLSKKENKLKYSAKVLYNLLYMTPKIALSKKEDSFRLANIVFNSTLKSITFNPKIDSIN